MKTIALANSHKPLYCNTSTGTQCPLAWHQIVLDSLHGLSHPGIRATQKLITARFVWPGINADIRQPAYKFQRAKIQIYSMAAILSSNS